MITKANCHIGSNFDDFLKEEGIFDEVKATALGRLKKRYGFHILWYEEGGHYVGTCPNFPHLTGSGDTPEEALSDIREVVYGVLELLQDNNEAPPKPTLYDERFHK